MRSPYVAGQFYSGNREGLKEQVEECFQSDIGPGELPSRGDAKRDIIGCVVPHAGYMYSGPVAAHVYNEFAKQAVPETIVIMGFSHRGFGGLAALSNEDWETPLGVVKTDKETVEELSKDCKLIDIDETAHIKEHSLEVQLPFLQYIYDDFKIVPLSLHYAASDIVDEISECLSKIEKDFLVIASSDFTHQETQESATKKDKKAISHILNMEEKRFLQTIYEHQETQESATKKDKKAISHILNMEEKRFLQTIYEDKISVCGYVPIATCIATTKKLGAKRAELLKYSTSGDVTGDHHQVVGYAGIVLRR
jgi:AmmeMemoRadiSam system protein B